MADAPKKKNKAAQAMGRRSIKSRTPDQLKKMTSAGGKARMQHLTEEERKALSRKGVEARLKKLGKTLDGNNTPEPDTK